MAEGLHQGARDGDRLASFAVTPDLHVAEGRGALPEARLYLLGGFRAHRGARVITRSDWLRRTAARQLVKLLAMGLPHHLHRDQIIERLWPDADVNSAHNRFHKALYAARRALEPDLPAHRTSRYLRITDDIVSLTDGVWVDVDQFERLAHGALNSGDEGALELALEAYTGDLLPEDLYADWSAIRRDELHDLHTRVMAALAGVREHRRLYDRAIAIWQRILAEDRTREDAHRALMRLYGLSGARSRALQQYETVKRVLAEDLAAEPEPATESLFHDLLAGRLSPAVHHPPAPIALPLAVQRAPGEPLVGRDRVMDVLRLDLEESDRGAGRVMVVSGELGVGKTRLLAELARHAANRGFLTLWGSGSRQQVLAPYGPCIAALEGYFAGRPRSELEVTAERYPVLSMVVPSLSRYVEPVAGIGPDLWHALLFAGLQALCADLATRHPLLLVIDGLHEVDAASLYLLEQLALNAPHHRWLIAASYTSELVPPGSGLHELLGMLRRYRLSRHITLDRPGAEDAVPQAQSVSPDWPTDLEPRARMYPLSPGNPWAASDMTEDGATAS